MEGNAEIKCIYCGSAKISKIGKRKNKLQDLQRYKCNSCNKTFTQNTQSKIGNKTYPVKIILNSISYYNLGYTQSEASKIIAQKYKIQVPQKTISNWLNEYKNICTYARLRKQSTTLYKPEEIIHKQTLSHIQPYTFKYHQAKLNILTNENPKFSTLNEYINKINLNEFPHHIFTYAKENNPNSQRASQLKFNHLKINNIKKQNQANELAKLALNLAKNNKQRHEAIQDFFLINDSVTIATEVPIHLTNWDAGYYRNQNGFIFPLSNYKTPVTGHIDILQIRNGLLHILDYKPEADKIQPIEQLTIYALALSRKLNLPLYHFKCAWFDENNYFEFYPLHGVYAKR